MRLLKGTAALSLILAAGCSYRRHVAVTPIPEPARLSVVVGTDTITYERAGDTLSGKPTVVLLHGFGAAMESWSDIQPMIAAKYPVLRVDLKGFGMSSKPKDSKYSARDQSDIVAGVLRALNVRRTVLVGHSFGGAVTFATYLKLRAEGDHRIVALGFIDPAVYDQPLPFFIAALRSSITRWLMFTFTTADWRADIVLRQVYAHDSVRTAERVRRYSKFMDLPGAHHSFARTAEQIIPPDAGELEAQLKTISVPTLVLWGEEDKIVPIAYGRRMRVDVPGVQYFTFPNTGHAPQEERPADTAARLLRFLDSLQNQRGGITPQATRAPELPDGSVL
jgi:pimeloyl-ACP methyl ester carboxylesterase